MFILNPNFVSVTNRGANSNLTGSGNNQPNNTNPVQKHKFCFLGWKVLFQANNPFMNLKNSVLMDKNGDNGRKEIINGRLVIEFRDLYSIASPVIKILT